MRNCIIKGCQNQVGESMRLFGVPNMIKYPDLAMLWVKYARDDIRKLYEKITKPLLTDPVMIWERDVILKNRPYMVCQAHFDEKCFKIDLRAKYLKNVTKYDLIHGSYPTIFDFLTSDNVDFVNEPVFPSEPFISSSTSTICEPINIDNQTKNFEEEIVEEPFTASVATQTCNNEFMTEKTPSVQVKSSQVDIEELNIKLLVDQGSDAYSESEIQESIALEIYNSSRKLLIEHSYAVPSSNPTESHAHIESALINSSPVCKITSSSPFINDLSPITSASNFTNVSTETSTTHCQDPSFYEPSEMESEDFCDDSFRPMKDISAKNLVHERKFLVFESELDNLLRRSICQNISCSKPIDTSTIRKSENEGSQLTVWFNCIDGHDNIWKSQPVLGKMPCGNLLIASAVLLSGATFHRTSTIFEFIGLKGISKSTYYYSQRQLVIPEINRTWQEEQYNICDELTEKDEIKLSADGRCDSPGHSAKYCTYSLMEQESNLIVHFEIVQKSEVDFKSTNMELEGLKRCLNCLEKSELVINQLTTDRHIQIRKYIREEHPNIDHQFDVWHLNKSIRTKLLRLCKIKENAELDPWSKTINRHLWYCSEHCEEDPDKLIDMWKSLLYHVTNVHEFPNFKYFKACGHKELDEQEREKKKWLDPESDSYKALSKLVNDKRLLKDIRQISKYSHTSKLESYHSLMNKYCSKQLDFDFDVLEARTQLAALDHNYNADRKMVLEVATIEGQKEEFAYYYSKATGEWHARPLKEPKSYCYIYDIMENILRRQMGSVKEGKAIKRIGSIAPISRPDKSQLVIAAKRRLQLD